MSTLKHFCFIVLAPLLGWFVYTATDRAHHKTLLKKPGDFDDEDEDMVNVDSNLLGEEGDANCTPNNEEENCNEEEQSKL